MKRLLGFGVATIILSSGAVGLRLFQNGLPNPTGKPIQPIVRGVPVGSYPVQMRLSPDGRFLVVTNTGFRQQLSVIDAQTGEIASTTVFRRSGKDPESLYWGLVFRGGELYVSRGPEDKVSVYELSADGRLVFKRDLSNKPKAGAVLPNFAAGLEADAETVYVLNNESGPSTAWKGSVSEIDPVTGALKGRVLVGGFPLSGAIVREGGKTKEIYVTSEQDGVVSFWHPGSRVAEDLPVGANPTCILERSGKLYVSNAGSDTISVIDPARHRVVRTILLRPPQLRGLPGCTPLGMDITRDGSTLFVALADMNAVAMVDLAKAEVRGTFPVGWYPTDVKLSPDGKRLFVANAKGVETRIPNGRPRGELGTYIENLIEGTVSMVPLDRAMAGLDRSSRQVLALNGLSRTAEPRAKSFSNPGIRHVIYIVKENRTYDNVLGDLPQGNGDASLCLFPREVTPNQHALAERFALLDNFFCCAEVSGDGWNWSTAGAANEYVSRNVPFNYSGRGRDYDFEGSVNGGNPDFEGIRDVAAPPGGYIWDNCRKSGVTFRNYGFFVGESDALGVKPGSPPRKAMTPVKKALVGMTDPNFNQYDLAYPDSELNSGYGIKVPSEMAAFGEFNAVSRFTEWKREFDGYVKSGRMPGLQLVRFCRDHTAGTAAGRLSPRAMVADNDYAVGQLVEAVSKSRFWKDTLICVVEDDAQAGLDHVDCHRSIAFVISPFIKAATHYSRFANTDSMLRTIEVVLGMPPMNGFDAIADPIEVFSSQPVNAAPYEAIRSPRAIAGETSHSSAYRSKDSARISRFTEESAPDVELNDILWGAIKGRPLPKVKTRPAARD